MPHEEVANLETSPEARLSSRAPDVRRMSRRPRPRAQLEALPEPEAALSLHVMLPGMDSRARQPPAASLLHASLSGEAPGHSGSPSLHDVQEAPRVAVRLLRRGTRALRRRPRSDQQR